MKRSLMVLAIMLGCTAIVSAQKTAAKTTATSDVKAAKASLAAKATATTTTKTKSNTMITDGTPDMRYKENKTAAKATTGPKKADGTADMRYKANKTAKAKS